MEIILADNWVIHNVQHTCFQRFINGQFLLSPIFFSGLAVPHAEIAWKPCEAFLLTKEEAEYFQVYTNDLVVLVSANE